MLKKTKTKLDHFKLYRTRHHHYKRSTDITTLKFTVLNIIAYN